VRRGNRLGAQGREGIVEEHKEEMEYVWSRGQRGNRRGVEGEGIVEEQWEERE
jgi:hypothetical protein